MNFPKFSKEDDDSGDAPDLDLSLSPPGSLPAPPLLQQQQPPQPPPTANEVVNQNLPVNGGRVSRQRKRQRSASDTIEAPYRWATKYRAKVLSMDELLKEGIQTISGQVQCKRCEKEQTIEYNLNDNFIAVARFLAVNKGTMHDRAPEHWLNPTLPKCELCGHENSCRPVISDKKRNINWLFLFLGQLLGCCTLLQLKYFCKHTTNHRTGAKDRVLYLAYLAMCKQLDPKGPFDYNS